jgi:hypothetical protein
LAAAQGLHGLQGLQAAAAQGLHGLHLAAAQGLQGLQAPQAALHGLQALQPAICTEVSAALAEAVGSAAAELARVATLSATTVFLSIRSLLAGGSGTGTAGPLVVSI